MISLQCKKIAWLIARVLLAMFCFLPLTQAAPEINTPLMGKMILSFHGYKITAYDVNVKVHENNALDVTERITAQFDEPKHGIYRTIPLIHKMQRLIQQENITYVQKNKISNISVTDGSTGQEIPVDKETKSGLVLKIGENGKTVIGEKTYVIQYRYELGDDGTKAFDELYYYLIGDQWDTQIGNITFTIEMPKAFDPNAIRFMLGSAETGILVPFEVKGNTITGRVEDVLGNGRGLTVRIDLPEGYFNSVEAKGEWIWLGVPAGLTICCLLLYFLFGRNPKLQTDANYFAGLTLNPAEVGYLLGGDSKNKGRMALIIHWANQGYLALEADTQDSLRLIKLKDADDQLKSYEQIMFNALFANGNSVTPNAVKDQFIGVMNKVASGVKDSFDDPSGQIYTSVSAKSRIVCYLSVIVCLALFSVRMVNDFYSWTDYFLIPVVMLAFSLLIFPFVIGIDYFIRKNGVGSPRGIIANSICFLLALGLLLGLAQFADTLDSVTYVVILAIGVCGFAAAFTRQRTSAGNRLLGQVIALKRQIETMAQAKGNESNRFYPLLPYAFAFGLEKKWAHAFENLEFEPPQWFRGRLINLFSTLYFTNLVSENMNTFESSMTYYDSSSGDGGGGSGGSGGGGGSW
ncbi:MAG: DUF2207 domain-containing protein [Sporomusaceae bacterium]|nr:DUF2207 domain-containing protein [Sporomusaceae bacterium]